MTCAFSKAKPTTLIPPFTSPASALTTWQAISFHLVGHFDDYLGQYDLLLHRTLVLGLPSRSVHGRTIPCR